MHTCMHVIPGMDAAAADAVADLILGAEDDSFDELMDAKMDAGDEK